MEGDAKASAFELESLPQKTGAVESNGTKPQVVEHLNLDEEAAGEQALAACFPFLSLSHVRRAPSPKDNTHSVGTYHLFWESPRRQWAARSHDKGIQWIWRATGYTLKAFVCNSAC